MGNVMHDAFQITKTACSVSASRPLGLGGGPVSHCAEITCTDVQALPRASVDASWHSAAIMWTSVQAGPANFVTTRLQHSPPQSWCCDEVSAPPQQSKATSNEVAGSDSQHDSPQHEPTTRAVPDEAKAFASAPT
ncbi:MAG: hypothetical protein ACKO4V_03160 [Planctomycetota bacterium]